MIAVPLIVVWVSTQVLFFKLPLFSAFVLSLILSFACSVALSRIWEHRSKREEISFSELMLWSWYRLHKAERKLEKGLRDAETSKSNEEQLQVLHGLTAALESKDPYTRGHSKRVERHSFKTGVVMGLALEEVEVLRMSASLHDVGKIRVPNRVLHKPGALSEEERSLIEEHPALGSEMVASMGNQEVVEAVRHHHERWDGDGYPHGRSGGDIPLYARVIAVADSYDAIRSNRSYRRGASRDQAVQVLTDESGRQFDPIVVEAFLKTLPARAPAVAVLSSLATGPGALWRYVQQLFQRFGSTALAPAIGAAGTAVVIGTTSLFGAGVPALATPLGMAAPEIATFEETSSSSIPQETAEMRASAALADQRRAERLENIQQKEQQAKDGARGGGSTSPTSGSKGDTTTTQEDPSTPDASGGDTTSGGGTTSGPDTTADDSTQVDGDPQDEGKDCKEGKRKESEGSRLHCD